ncbi:type II/IV secretion system ATPase subunit [Candidatus Woesearchaeota archaeon]|nr:type II/IV secretion system ATPase subunit [Candidatus Woesearchaeota archaeon]
MATEAESKRGYEIIKEGDEEVLRINALNWNFTPSLEDSPICMGLTIDYLVESPTVSRIIFSQRRNYTYSYEQTRLLQEIANLYKMLSKQKKVISLASLSLDPNCASLVPRWTATLQRIISSLLRTDPIGAYVELKRQLRSENIFLKKSPLEQVECCQSYINLLNYVVTLLEQTRLVQQVKREIAGYALGDRTIYAQIFRPTITPNFMFTRLMASPPEDGIIREAYDLGSAEVNIFETPDSVRPLYHLTPPEFKLTEDKYAMLDLARSVLAEHKPRDEEFLEPERMRSTFFNIGRDLLQELAEQRNVNIGFQEVSEMAEILVRYTIGFGLIETLLQDERVQDIVINGPIGQTPIFIVHQQFDECVTNLIPSREDADSWASKFRILSGRSLDEANPILDTELSIPGARARVAIVQSPLNPHGLGYSLRRHRDKPWTLTLFVENRTINPLAAGLLSFLIDGARTILFAGTRSSGKTSLLGATLIEIMRKFRIITIEDTLELPTEALRTLGYNIQAMKVRSALTKGGAEVPADEGIRASLRMGDSSLIVGEIRSSEAFALYEAMRIGALANVVAGTIHGDSPYGVFDRVVNDLKVPKTSFKATDVIVISNPIKSADGLHRWRRVLQITEVRKHWEEDPIAERGFVDLMRYNPKTDELEPTPELMNGDSEVLKAIAGNVKEWAGDWDAVWNNIMLRTKIKETVVDYARKYTRSELLEADFTTTMNDAFHKISSRVREKSGKFDTEKIFEEWHTWFKEKVKK